MVSSQPCKPSESIHLTGVSMYVDPLNPPDAVCMITDVSRDTSRCEGTNLRTCRDHIHSAHSARCFSVVFSRKTPKTSRAHKQK